MLESSKPGMPNVNLNTATSRSSSPNPVVEGTNQGSTSGPRLDCCHNYGASDIEECQQPI
jgi:hypothetical protein